MQSFDVKEEFRLNGQAVKLISGAVHYFRIVPAEWRRTLYNLKALGCNTVETYIPWNLHEPQEGSFYFEGLADVERFIQTAAELELLVILRPTPYICAEWEFGGLPAWLLNDSGLRVRSSSAQFMEKVTNYYKALLPRLLPYQIDQGGPVIMMQVENEYGSFGNDKAYLKALADLMRQLGVTVPLFTSDGDWQEVLESGSLIEADILATANFGSGTDESFDELAAFFERHDKKWPLMCMEFWDGWFNRYHDPIIRRDPAEIEHEVERLLKRGSLNFYMFQGGTNFGFMNGCSVRNERDLPQITSYDYDALLTEWGAPTEKYFAAQRAIGKVCPEVQQMEPKTKETCGFGEIRLARSMSLFDALDQFEKKTNTYPLTMEECGHPYGYMLYRTTVAGPKPALKCKIVEASDRVQLYRNAEYLGAKYQEELQDTLQIAFPQADNTVDLLIENMGRVNYGEKLLAHSQRKGLRSGFKVDIHFEADWEMFLIDPARFSRLVWAESEASGSPHFHEYVFEIDTPADTFLDIRPLGKGIAVLNDFHLGRYWTVGPQGYLYIPETLLKSGENRLIIFETEGQMAERLELLAAPVYIEVGEEQDNA
ncbi:glycoside hydrolase family 35 protein [Listeria costaricensis]|uniref:glycoside hydrolase family 35 protein n=1 Tax=Listeria costaricensis TaxID=2026604 RepID=UPI000C06EE06|nr:beta-galactosidase family protein [Listeria costaricensis]